MQQFLSATRPMRRLRCCFHSDRLLRRAGNLERLLQAHRHGVGVARRALLHDSHGSQHAVGRCERHDRSHEPARTRRVDAEEIHSPLDDGRRVKPTKGAAPGQTVVDRAGEPG